MVLVVVIFVVLSVSEIYIISLEAIVASLGKAST